MIDRKVMLIRKKFLHSFEQILRDIQSRNKRFKISQYLTFLLGVSGGSDSVALLDLFYNLSLQKNIFLAVAHFNHRIRGEEAVRDENFVKEMCKKLNIKILIGRMRKKSGIINEEVLRKERFKFFKRAVMRLKAEFLVLAHTKDDNLETVFMNLLKGKVQKPFLGIKPWRQFTERCFLIHPLLNISKSELLEYIIHSNLNFVIDSSNLNNAYFRNYIRQEIFPAFKTFKNSFFRSLEVINKKWNRV